MSSMTVNDIMRLLQVAQLPDGDGYLRGIYESSGFGQTLIVLSERFSQEEGTSKVGDILGGASAADFQTYVRNEKTNLDLVITCLSHSEGDYAQILSALVEIESSLTLSAIAAPR